MCAVSLFFILSCIVLALLVKAVGNCQDNNLVNIISKLSVSFWESHLRNKKTFSKIVTQEVNKTISEKEATGKNNHSLKKL